MLLALSFFLPPSFYGWGNDGGNSLMSQGSECACLSLKDSQGCPSKYIFDRKSSSTGRTQRTLAGEGTQGSVSLALTPQRRRGTFVPAQRMSSNAWFEEVLEVTAGNSCLRQYLRFLTPVR